MFSKISFYVNGDSIELSDKTYLLGHFSVDILNITPSEFKVMHDTSEEMAKLLDSIQKQETPRRGDVLALNNLNKQLHKMLMERELFKIVCGDIQFDNIENACRDDKLFYDTFTQDFLLGNYANVITRYCEIVDDIYSFNQTIFWFVDRFLSHLRKLDSENYAGALFDFYSEPTTNKMIVNHLRNGRHNFTLLDTVNVRYVPRVISGKPDNYAIFEHYSVDYLQAFLKIDFMKAIMCGHIIRRCKNCKQFFLLTKGYHTDYCDRALPNNPSKNCRHIGAKNIAKEKAKNNPIIQSYNNAFQRISVDLKRGYISEADLKKAKKKIIDLRDMAISGKYRDAEVDELMQSKNLYTSLGIVRKGGR